ncbi:MAG: nucleotide exchange factor GrpE [bacterium]
MNDEDIKKEEEMDQDVDDVVFVESTEDGDALPTKEVAKKLLEDLKQARKRKEEYLTGWQRAKADYINLQKESGANFARGKELGVEELVDSLLPAMDAFDMAMSNKEAWEAVDKNWRQGIEYIHSKLIQALADNNISVIASIGVKFDPMLHEALQSIPTDDESKDHTVASVTQSGYKMGERVIRPARVNIWEYK